MHVVVVDPSRVIRKRLAEMLTDGGHTSVVFENSTAALVHVTSDLSVNCVLTSLEVQPLDGFELCWSLRALAAERRPLTILAMSSARDARSLEEVLDSGADDFLRKPPSPQELNGRLRSAERVLGLQRALIQQADRDYLTELFNRRAIMRELELAIASASERRALSVLQIDIDHFKSINDRYGHDVGDLVIRRAARILRETGAIAGRVGGEEFVLLIPDHSLGSAAVVAHRVRNQCAGLTQRELDNRLRFTVSIGLSQWAMGDNVASLLKRADVALYAAKTGGRDRVAVTSVSLQTEMVS